jgi:hypothetical protein
MVKRYYGGVISATQLAISSVSASGFFNHSTALQAKQAGNWPTVSTGPTVIGQSYGGGYYAGKISLTGGGVATHYLIVAPRSTGQSSTDNAFNNNNVADSGATSLIDGLANTNSMNDANHPQAQFCRSLTIGGYTDWYMPALNELITMYYFLKPTTTTNSTSGAGHGSNANAVSPQPISSNFTSGNPAQTTAALFQSGNTEAFNTYGLWSSTQSSSTQAYRITTDNGTTDPLFKNSYVHVRAVRKIPI